MKSLKLRKLDIYIQKFRTLSNGQKIKTDVFFYLIKKSIIKIVNLINIWREDPL